MRIFITAIIPADGRCDIELVQSVAGYFSLSDGAAKDSEISRMESAFEHDDLARALRIQG